MAFTVAFIAHSPDGDRKRNRSLIETAKYKLFTIIVKNQQEAIEECKDLVKNEGIHAVLLCPGFSHKDVSEISDAVGKDVGVAVARSDGPSSKTIAKVMKAEGWFE